MELSTNTHEGKGLIMTSSVKMLLVVANPEDIFLQHLKFDFEFMCKPK